MQNTACCNSQSCRSYSRRAEMRHFFRLKHAKGKVSGIYALHEPVDRDCRKAATPLKSTLLDSTNLVLAGGPKSNRSLCSLQVCLKRASSPYETICARRLLPCHFRFIPCKTMLQVYTLQALRSSIVQDIASNLYIKYMCIYIYIYYIKYVS